MLINKRQIKEIFSRMLEISFMITPILVIRKRMIKNGTIPVTHIINQNNLSGCFFSFCINNTRIKLTN